VRLLHIALSTAAVGETYIGLALAGQLAEAGVQSHFVTATNGAALVGQHGYPGTVLDRVTGADARAVLDRVVAEVRPDAAVLVDYITYVRAMRRRLHLDPWMVEDYGLPVLPVDLAELAATDLEMDLCGWAGGLAVDPRILDLPAHLRPVPTAHPEAGDDRAFPYRLLPPEPPVAAAERAAVRADLGLGPGDRLIMAPMAAWQTPGGAGGMNSPLIGRLTERVPELLVHYLRRLPPTAHVLVVGYAPPAFAGLPAERLHVLPPVPAERYRTLLGSADLVLLLSMIGVTGVRAVLMDVPVLVVQNRFPVPDEDAVDAVEAALGRLSPVVASWLRETVPVEPFRMWPKGLYHFFTPMLRDNGYLTALAVAELLDEDAVVSGLTDLLYDRESRDRLAGARARYLAELAALPPTAEVFAAAAARVGLAVP
jgi:Family of unknown function (DUF6365)